MGWSGGSQLLEDIMTLTYKYIPKNKRLEVCKRLIVAFEDHDCVIVSEAFSKEWPELEEAFRELWPKDE